MIERIFKLKERNTSVRIEFTAGMSTFFAMVYILMINANMFSDPHANGQNILGVSYEAIYIATALSAVVGTFLAGVIANLPLGLASGMGLNAFFVYTVCISLGFSYANGLVLILIDGIVFILLTVTGLRKKIFDAIPLPVRAAIPVGIGLFIAFLGLQNSGIVVASEETCVDLASFNLRVGSWGDIMPLLVTLVTFFAIVIMANRKIKGAVFLGILGGMALYYLLGITVPGFYENLSFEFISPLQAFKQFGSESLFTVITEGFDFSEYIKSHGFVNMLITVSTTSLAFCLVDLFDTLGTLYATCEHGNMLDENGEIINMNKAMLSDAIATTTGALCGTSTVTTFSETTVGVAEGGRTGLTAIFTALGFFVAMFFSPIARLIPSAATAAALIYVGVLMISSVKKIEWSDIRVAVPAFMTMAIMPFSYNISYGIAFGIISYIIINLFTGKAKEIKVGTCVIALLFIIMLLLTH